MDVATQSCGWTSWKGKHDFEPLETAVRRHVMDALKLAHGNGRQAAALLGVSRWRLARMVRRFKLQDFVTTLRREGEPVARTLVAEKPHPARCGHDD